LSSTVTASARLFTAANSEYFSAADAAWNSPTGSWYQCGWVNLTTNATQVVLLAKYGTGGNQGWQTYYNNATSKFGLTQSHDGTNTVGVEFGSTSSTGTWYFVENYYDSVNQLCGININRGTDATVAQTNGQFDSSLAIRWGAQSGGFYANASGGPTVFLSGMPTAAERNALYNSGNGVLYKDRPTFSTATILAWYDMAETSGQAYDANGTNHLTDNNTVTSAAGKVTYTAEDASQFTSANSEYLSISNAAQSGLDPGVGNPFYVCGWLYPTSGTASGYPVIFGKDSGTNGYDFFFNLTGTAPYLIDRAHGVSTIWASELPLSKWSFVEFFFNGTNQGVSVDRATDLTNANLTGPTTSSTEVLLGHYSGATNYYNGRMANFVFISGMPTTADRNALYNRGFGVDVSDKPTLNNGTYVSWWKLDEASGTRFDSIGNNDLTDNNSVTGNPGVVYDAVTPPPAGGNYGSTLGFSGIIQ